jgi:hypothetical protein
MGCSDSELQIFKTCNFDNLLVLVLKDPPSAVWALYRSKTYFKSLTEMRFTFSNRAHLKCFYPHPANLTTNFAIIFMEITKRCPQLKSIYFLDAYKFIPTEVNCAVADIIKTNVCYLKKDYKVVLN